MKKKFICTVCGYIHEGEEAPEKCPLCGAPANKFNELTEDTTPEFAAEHKLGIALEEDVPAELLKHCRMTFAGECTEVGMYLAMARQADREGYPEIARAFEHYAMEEANHAARYDEFLGSSILHDTKTNIEVRMAAEKGATSEKFEAAKLAKANNLDALHDSIHEMARDEARHSAGFMGLYKRYFENK